MGDFQLNPAQQLAIAQAIRDAMAAKVAPAQQLAANRPMQPMPDEDAATRMAAQADAARAAQIARAQQMNEQDLQHRLGIAPNFSDFSDPDGKPIGQPAQQMELAQALRRRAGVPGGQR